MFCPSVGLMGPPLSNMRLETIGAIVSPVTLDALDVHLITLDNTYTEVCLVLLLIDPFFVIIYIT